MIDSWPLSRVVLETAFATTASSRPDLEGRFPCVLTRGAGASVFDVDGNQYLDLTGSHGAVLIGHAESRVSVAATEAIAEGNLLHTGASPRRIALTARLLAWFPWAQRVMFFKTGSCAVSAAARLAQHRTGRTRILTSGYHGWHDWQLAALPELQVQGTWATDFDYDLARCATLLEDQGEAVAAIIVTPLPGRHQPAIYQELRTLATRYGCALILDEVKTAMRAGPGGYSARASVVPDAVTVSKGLANGHSISAVIGTEMLLSAVEFAHLSNTYQDEQSSFAAGLATMDLLTDWDVPPQIAEAGHSLGSALTASLSSKGAPVLIRGWGPAFELDFLEGGAGLAETLQDSMLRHGIFCDVTDDFNVSYRLAQRWPEAAERMRRAVEAL